MTQMHVCYPNAYVIMSVSECVHADQGDREAACQLPKCRFMSVCVKLLANYPTAVFVSVCVCAHRSRR